MNYNPFVSIIIPAYNAEKYIARSLKSALDQTYKNIEIIVIDDGSIDKTAEIVKSFSDPRIRYLYQENKNVGAARNYGIKESRGKYITFLDADDEYLPEKVAKEVEFLERHPEYKTVYCDTLQYFSEKQGVLFVRKGEHPSGDIFPFLLRSSVINLNAIMIERKTLIAVGMFDERPHFPEDWELWLRLAKAGFSFGHIHEGLVKVEMRKDSKTTSEVNLQAKKYLLEVFKNLFSAMTPEERKLYRTDAVLKSLRCKIAIIRLINILPPSLKSQFLFLWRWYQRRKYERVSH